MISLTAYNAYLAAEGVYRPTRERPEGAENIEKVVNWIAWGFSIACIIGIFAVAGAMVLAHQRREGAEHMTRLGWVLGGMVLGGGASALVGAFI